jgi:DNA repair exonuclease SbcCD ATPase subunit
VAVDLRDEDGTWYQVERWRKYKAAGESRQSSGVRMCIEDSEGCPQQCHEALDEKETNRLICEKLGLDRDIWCRGVVFGQESAFNFCEATAKDRTAILTTVMGVEVIDTWLERCRDEKRALSTKMAESGGKLEIARQALSRAEGEHPETRLQQWEAEREADLAAADKRLANMAARGKKLFYDLEVFKGTQPRPKVPPMPPPVSDVAVRAAREAWQASTAEKARADATAGVLKRRVEQLQGLELGECPTCLQPVTEEHKGPCVAAAQLELDGFGPVMAGVLEVCQGRKEALDAAEAAYRAAQAERERATGAVMQAQQAASSWDNSVRALTSQLEIARQGWKLENERRGRVASQANPFADLVEKHQKRLETLRWELAALEDEQKGIGEALDVALWWEKELPRFRTWLFDSVVDTLAAEANRWLRIMSGGVIWVQISTTRAVGKRLRDELDVQVYRWQPDGSVTTRSYRTWSGGEKRRVALAVDLGLSRLLADRASKAYRFLSLDEIDRHLDAQGREGLRQVLDELRRDKETILTITHDQEFRASFDTEVLVTKRGGVSNLEVRGVREEG